MHVERNVERIIPAGPVHAKLREPDRYMLSAHREMACGSGHRFMEHSAGVRGELAACAEYVAHP